MQRKLGEVPVEALVVTPFFPLAEFASLEEQFFSGMGPHQCVEHPQVGEFLPHVSRHFAEQGAFAVHDFVVAEDKDEVLVERVEQRESDAALVVATVDRIQTHVVEEVVHPPHIPFESESEAAEVCRARDTRPSGRFFGNGNDAGKALVADLVEALEKIDRIEVFPSAETIGYPLAAFARVVEVEHRGHRIHPQPIDMILVEPEKRVGDEEIPHLVASVVENIRPPIAMLPLPRIGVFVKVRTVEIGQPVRILREVGRHPVKNDSDSRLVAMIDEVAELIRITEPAGRRVIPRHLVAPGPVVGMLGHRHQLDVGEAHLQAVGNEPLGEFDVAEGTVFFLCHALP